MQPLNIIYTISESAKSKVYLVEDASGNPAILKCRSNASGDIYRRLQKEKMSCVPDIYEIEESEDGVSVLEEQVSGITVRDALEQNSIKGGKELTDILLKICSCMILLHKCEPPIIYRDLKPENILITDDGKVMLIDFDAARDYKEDSEHDTVMLGTREYAAPEQYGFSQTDIRTDVYSFGIIMKEMVEAAGINGTCRRNLDKLIRKTTMFDPKDRPVSFRVIEKELKGIRNEIQHPALKYIMAASTAAVLIVLIVSMVMYIRTRNEYNSSIVENNDAVEEYEKKENAITSAFDKITVAGAKAFGINEQEQVINTTNEVADTSDRVTDTSDLDTDTSDRVTDSDSVYVSDVIVDEEYDEDEAVDYSEKDLLIAESWDAAAYEETLTTEKILAEKQIFSAIDLDYDGDDTNSCQWFNESDDAVAFWGYPDDVEACVVKIDSDYNGRTVTIFDCYCLSGRKSLREVVISVGYTEIKENALADDPNLTAVYIPATVTYIAASAFEKSPNAVIYCTDGSYAQHYAQIMEMECVILK